MLQKLWSELNPGQHLLVTCSAAMWWLLLCSYGLPALQFICCIFQSARGLGVMLKLLLPGRTGLHVVSGRLKRILPIILKRTMLMRFA